MFLGYKGQNWPLHSAAEIWAAFKIIDFKGTQASPADEKLNMSFHHALIIAKEV
jgi:hypothetical protein